MRDAHREEELEELRSKLSRTRRAPITLAEVTCGKCVFFRNSATYGKPCTQMGILEDQEICGRFVVDPRALSSKEDPLIELLGAIAAFPKSKRSLIAALLAKSAALSRNGLQLGETVYFRLLGGDYLSNYLRGTVLSIRKGTVSVLGKQGFTAALHRDSLLSLEDFHEKKEELVAKGRLHDPDRKVRKLKDRVTVDWEPAMFARPEVEDPDPERVKRGRGRPRRRPIGPKRPKDTKGAAIRVRG